MKRRFGHSVSALALGLMLAGPAGATMSSVTEAAGVNTLVRFDLDEGPLSDILIEFTDVTGLGLVFDSRLVAGRTAPPVKGEYSARLALDMLLKGSGLKTVSVGGDTLAIVRIPDPAAGTATNDTEPEPSLAFNLTTAPVIDELLVVGTRTANPPYYKFKPTLALEGQDLRFSGTVNVSDFVFELPSMLSDVTAANTTIYGTPAGLNLADLRGLGPERTLVLVNGRRYTPTFGGSLTLFGVDLNGIPAALVKRIDIISGGATTSYGGEAVAGVINFMLEDDIEGWSGAVQAGITDRDDREELLASLTYGTKFAGGRGHVVASLSIDDQGGLLMKDREVTAAASGFALDGRVSYADESVLTPGFGRSPLTPEGYIEGIVDNAGGVTWLYDRYNFTADGRDLEPHEGRLDQLYDYTTDHSLLTPLHRIFGTLNANYDVGGGHRLVVESSVADTHVTSSLAPVPLAVTSGLVRDDGSFISIPLDNPFIPSAVFDLLANEGLSDSAGLVVAKRFPELGPRKADIRRRTYRSLVGMQGMLAPDWSYDVYFQYGRNAVTEERTGYLDLNNYAASVDPTLCASVPGCSLVNPFGTGRITAEQVSFLLAAPVVRHISTNQYIASGVISGPLEIAPEMVAQVTFGAEYRWESLKDMPDDSLAARPVSGSLLFPGSSGHFDVLEAFGDVTLPVFSDEPLAHELTATMGLRLSQFSTVGTLANWHVGGLWEPVAGLRGRVSYQYGRRAPTVAELYAGGPGGFDFVEDPCSTLEGVTDATLLENCLSRGDLGVREGYEADASPTDVLSYGNPKLDPETSSNVTWGISIDSDELFRQFPGRLKLSVDAYRIRIRDYMLLLDADQLLQECYNSTDLESPFCGTNPVSGDPYITRDPASGHLAQVSETVINAGRFWLKGYDVDLRYTLNLRQIDSQLPFDEVTASALYTRLLESRVQFEEGGYVYSLLGSVDYTRHRLQGGLTFTRGTVSMGWDFRYRGHAVSISGLEELPEANIRGQWYHDISARVALKNGMTLYGGIRNLFDRDAPTVYGGTVGDTFPEYYDALGRRFYMGAVFDF